MARYYSGVGSRGTPAGVLEFMTRAARELGRRGWILRSGHAAGADRAFEAGAAGRAVIYLPWNNFGVNPYRDDPGAPVLGLEVVRPRDELLASHAELVRLGLRPAADAEAVRLLHGRNWCQVLGHAGSAAPSRFVLCWCRERNGRPQGGTATAVSLARRRGIPVFNLRDPAALAAVEAGLAAGSLPGVGDLAGS